MGGGLFGLPLLWSKPISLLSALNVILLSYTSLLLLLETNTEAFEVAAGALGIVGASSLYLVFTRTRMKIVSWPSLLPWLLR